MIKKIAWDTFKKTGDIDAFLEFKQIKEKRKQYEEKHSLLSYGKYVGNTLISKGCLKK